MTVFVPYYQEDGIVIYCGDCRDILPTLEPVDLVLTDPPYGISLDTSYSKYKNSISYNAIKNDEIPFNAFFLLQYGKKLIIWGANCFANTLPNFPGWLAWIKIDRNGAKIRQSEMELAWTNFIARPQCFRWTWIGAYKEGQEHCMVHPTQKPLPLMRWCLSFADGNVLDPFMGSGTTPVAAKHLGRKAIGIEIEEKYCEIAVKRLAQGVFSFES